MESVLRGTTLDAARQAPRAHAKVTRGNRRTKRPDGTVTEWRRDGDVGAGTLGDSAITEVNGLSGRSAAQTGIFK